MLFLKTSRDNKDHDELVKSIVKSCLKSTCVVLSCIIAFELYFYINCWAHSARFGWIGPWYRACYFSLLIESVIGLILIIYCNNDYDNRYHIMKWLSPLYSVLIVIWALSITFLDCLKSQKCSPIIIMTILLCIPACIYINPIFNFLLNIVANLVMMSMFIWAPGGGDSADIYNYLVFAIIQIIVSRFFLSTKFNYYKSTQEVIRHEKEVAELKIKEEAMEQQKKQAEEMTLLLIKTLSDTIEAKDEYTIGHSNRVSEYSALIAEKIGLSEAEVSRIKYAATLHDIGKIGVPDTVLNKPSKLTHEEYEIIKAHSNIGADILKNIDMISYTSDIARHHHERYDGGGYPDGLAGEGISIGARIVAVADAFDAMNSKRIYRNPLDIEIIKSEFEKNKGKQFDPQIADIFLEMLNAGDFDSIYEEKISSFVNDNYNLNSDAEKIISAVVDTMRTNNKNKSVDTLTGLLLRGAGEARIVELMATSPGALLFCDMDNLKTINDMYGHISGDKALKILGGIIAKYGENGVACRVGGDEFLLYLNDVSEEEVIKTIEAMVSDFAHAVEGDASINSATLSAGICLTSPSDLYSNIINKADKALYHVKQRGKAGYYIYHDELLSSDDNSHIDINQITKSISEAGKYEGALDVEYRQFTKMYDYLHNICKRYNRSCSVVLVTLDAKYNNTTYIDNIEQGMHCMEMAIRNTIREVDICTRYSSVQFLVILLEAEGDNVDAIMNRIFASFYKLNSESDLLPKYEVSPLIVNEE